MATWQEMSLNSRKAAKEALVLNCLRSSISRSYFAAYCAVTSQLAGKFTFSHGSNNPAHSDLPNMILNNLSAVPENQRHEIRKALRRLWKSRIEADYVPNAFMDRHIAMNALRDASGVLLKLGIKDD